MKQINRLILYLTMLQRSLFYHDKKITSRLCIDTPINDENGLNEAKVKIAKLYNTGAKVLFIEDRVLIQFEKYNSLILYARKIGFLAVFGIINDTLEYSKYNVDGLITHIKNIEIAKIFIDSYSLDHNEKTPLIMSFEISSANIQNMEPIAKLVKESSTNIFVWFNLSTQTHAISPRDSSTAIEEIVWLAENDYPVIKIKPALSHYIINDWGKPVSLNEEFTSGASFPCCEKSCHNLHCSACGNFLCIAESLLLLGNIQIAKTFNQFIKKYM